MIASKKLMQKAGNPLALCIRRLSERPTFVSCAKFVDFAPFVSSVEHNCGLVPIGFKDALQFKKNES